MLQTEVEFLGDVSHFLGVKFDWSQKPSSLQVHLSQPAFIDHLAHEAGLHEDSASAPKSPYRSGLPIDSIPTSPMSTDDRTKLRNRMQQLMGSLQWLLHCTRPDIFTATALLSQYQHSPSPGHLQAAKYIVRYLKGTASHGIRFDSSNDNIMQSFLHFPNRTKQRLTGISDANWGAQDQSLSFQSNLTLDLYKSRSFSGHIITLHGPIHWSSKRQSITARSSAESEIYATDECTKNILHIRHILSDLLLSHTFCPDATTIYNDNNACVLWSSNMATKDLRHVQIRENDVRKSVQKNAISVKHVAGIVNLADLFNKEDRDIPHFTSTRDVIMSDRPTYVI